MTYVITAGKTSIRGLFYHDRVNGLEDWNNKWWVVGEWPNTDNLLVLYKVDAEQMPHLLL